MSAEFVDKSATIHGGVAEKGSPIANKGSVVPVRLSLAPLHLFSLPAEASELTRKTREFIEGPVTPERLTEIIQFIWNTRGKKIKRRIRVPDAPFSQKEINQVIREGRMFGYMPPGMELSETRPRLAKALGTPMQGARTVAGENSVGDLINFIPAGWFDYELSPYPPNTSLTEFALDDLFFSQGRLGMGLPHYMVASADSEIFTGRIFDQNRTVHSRLPGSLTLDVNIIHAHSPIGTMVVYENKYPGTKYDGLGGRSVKIYDNRKRHYSLKS